MGSIPQVNRKRQAKRKKEGKIYGVYHRAVKELACIGWESLHHGCEAFPPDRLGVEGHHVKSIGAGGVDEKNEVPVCPLLHDQIEGKIWGWSRSRVEKMLGFSLEERALEIWDRITGVWE